MINRLFPSRRRLAGAPPALPPGKRIYAIGDIHGRRDLLDDILARIERDDAGRPAAETTLVFLGDLVDRGPDSAGVVQRVIELAASGTRVRGICGNHEEVFLAATAGDAHAVRTFCRIGGRETILSYGLSADAYEHADHPAIATELAIRVPPAHRKFLADLEDMIIEGDFAFVHAGIRPGVPLERQRQSDLRWIRDPFLRHHGPFEKLIVHGHTITAEVDRHPNRIGIDTGAYATGVLTALGLEGPSQWLLDTR